MTKRQWLADWIRSKLTRQQMDRLGSSERVDEYCRQMADMAMTGTDVCAESLKAWTPPSGSRVQ